MLWDVEQWKSFQRHPHKEAMLRFYHDDGFGNLIYGYADPCCFSAFE